MAWHYVITTGYNALTIAEQTDNVYEFQGYFNGYMTIEAMAGILGNMSYESGMNPGQQERGYGGNTNYGYGLIQWTPGTVIINWASQQGGNWFDGAMQCYRIKCEGEKTMGATGVWLPTSAYPYTWPQYCQLTDVGLATKAYFYERERGTWNVQREVWALYWHAILQGHTPTPPDPPTPTTPHAILKMGKYKWRKKKTNIGQFVK